MVDRADLSDLYQEVILEHSKAPRNFRKPATANQEAEGYNPLCGDRCSVFIDMDGDAIKEIGFQGTGCAISRASASMMTQMLKGKTKAEAVQLFDQFHRLVTGEEEAAARHLSSASWRFSRASPNIPRA